jgi:hypothetical protein
MLRSIKREFGLRLRKAILRECMAHNPVSRKVNSGYYKETSSCNKKSDDIQYLYTLIPYFP